MSAHRQGWWKTGSLAFGLAGVGLLVGAILWSPAIVDVFRSRLALSLIAVCCGGFAFWLHPEVRAGWALGIREFRKAAREILGDDDDDGPRAG